MARSAASTLAVDRYDTAKGGKIAYQRGSIQVSTAVAHGSSDGKSVVVIHGVDHNHDGKYNGSKKSDLDPSLPTEATDPALCGALHLGPQGGMATGDGGAVGGMNEGLIALGGAGVLGAAVAAGFARSRRRSDAA